MKLVSIIIPLYNQEKYIEECLNSIINQTYSNLEIIIIDDDSSDSSLKIVREYEKEDSRIKVITQKHSGVSKARNTGLKKATGDYIMFVDPDDYLEYNTVRFLMDNIKDEDILIFNFYEEYSKKQVKNKPYIKTNDTYEIQASILDPNHNPNLKGVGYAWNKIIKHDFLKNSKIKFRMENMHAITEGGLFYYELLERTNKVKVINKYLYHCRISNTSILKSYNEDIIDISKVIYNRISKLKTKHKKDPKFKESLDARMVNNFCLALDVNILNKKSKLKYKEKKDIINELIESEEYKTSLEEVSKNKKSKKKLRFYARLARKKSVNLMMIAHKFEILLKR